MTISKMKDGRFKVDISVGTNPLTNKRIRIRQTGFKTKREAKEFEVAQLQLYSSKRNYTLTKKYEDVLDEYLTYVQDNFKPSTHHDKVTTFNKHINIYFKGKLLEKITIHDLKVLRQEISKKNLSDRTKQKILGYLTSFFNYCVKYDYLSVNLANKLDRFKVRKKEMKFWTLTDFKKFISVVDNIDYYTFFNLLFYTGLRRGELLALTWNDINFNTKELNINKSLITVAGIGRVTSTPKTNAGVRRILLDKNTIEVLTRYYEHTSKEYGFKEDSLIFKHKGSSFPNQTLRDKFNKYIQIAQVERIRIHDLRHSHVALLINLGVDPYAIKERVGHEEVTTTLNTYGHLYKDKQLKLVDKLNNLF
ncbi:tyrosine-type recombinase/integrase [Mycoplasmatota bacterium WC44]